MRIIILGAGLAGLTTAYLLRQAPIDIIILEARERLGGRIWTKTIAGNTPVEAGATWFGMKHQALVGLLAELEVAHFPQATEGISLFEPMSFTPPQQFFIPESEPPSYRIQGGSSSLIHALEKHIQSPIHLGEAVETLSISEAGCEVVTHKDTTYSADLVISTIPPRLFVHTVNVTPALPAGWKSLAAQTHTWMADSIKFFVSYASRFWAERQFSGTVFSQTGLIAEMYDHSSADLSAFALKGFLAGRAYRLSSAQRKKAVLEHLVAYFGPQAGEPLEYGDVGWQHDPFTRVPGVEELFPHQNNGHEALREPLFDGRLLFAGAETATQFPGYMDGAVRAARRVAEHVLQRG